MTRKPAKRTAKPKTAKPKTVPPATHTASAAEYHEAARQLRRGGSSAEAVAGIMDLARQAEREEAAAR